MRKNAVFLDRDGVINKPIIRNKKPFAPRSLNDFKIYRHSSDAILKLKNLGFIIVVVTNQPDVGNKLLCSDTLHLMHKVMLKSLPIDLVMVCPHSQNAGCDCRKPGTALFSEALQRLGIKPETSFMVGDRISDIQAGESFGCKTIFIDRKYLESDRVQADYTVSNLKNAVRIICDAVS